jgi:hypothetical protein
MKHTLLATVLLVFPAAAWAQTPPPSTHGPLVVERLENHFIVAPDYKVTEIDGDTAQLAGGYAGWLAEDTLLVGGAAYHLVDGPSDADLTYGGLLVGWSTPAEHRIQFGARGLVGVGRATLGTDVTRVARFGARRGGPALPPLTTTTVRIRGEDDFFVFEPQLTLVTKLTDHIGITWGAGYRVTGYTEFAGDRLRGVTGSVALQIAGW